MKKSSYLIAGIAAFSVMSLAASVEAKSMHGGKGMRGPMIDFSAADANGDGKLTPEELAAHAKARFDAADVDGNGSLSADEIKAQVQARAARAMAKRSDRMAARLIDRMDSNDDGEVSFEEMSANKGRADRMFKRLDTDGDGAISAEEHAALGERGKGMHRRGEHEMGGHMRGHRDHDGHEMGHGHGDRMGGKKRGECQDD